MFLQERLAPSRTSVTCWLNGPTAYSTYFGLNAQSCFATWGQTTEKKMQDSSKESGTAWGLLVAAQRSSLTTHQDLPPGFVTCHNVQSARPAAKKPPRSLSRFEQWGSSPGKQGVVNGQHLCMLHKWRSISFCIFTRCKKHHSIASLAAKSIVPAALMENVPYQHADCHKLPDTVFHLERPKQSLTMAQLGCLKSIFGQVWRTQLGHSWHMCCNVCVCACSCACVVEGDTLQCTCSRERERESLLLRKNCMLRLAFWDIASFQNYVIVHRSYSSQGDTERTNPLADKCDISLVHNCTPVCNAACTDPCQDIIIVPSMLNACIARLCLLWGEAIAGR